MAPARRAVLLWTAAVLITLVAVVYQRLVGPTRPVRGSVVTQEAEIRFRLARSHAGPTDHDVRIAVPAGTDGTLHHRRHRTDDPWTSQPMRFADGALLGRLPHQPPAGKLAYYVTLNADATQIPPTGPVVIRFRGGVPAGVMVPHVLFMFLAMIWSNRAGLEALAGGARLRQLSGGSLALMVVGGLVFGPIVQWYAFGAAWTGFPVGYDLTDNKTLLATLAWLGAMIAVARGARAQRWWVLGAALVTLMIFSIPHSVLGSELDYSTLPTPAVP